MCGEQKIQSSVLVVYLQDKHMPAWHINILADCSKHTHVIHDALNHWLYSIPINVVWGTVKFIDVFIFHRFCSNIFQFDSICNRCIFFYSLVLCVYIHILTTHNACWFNVEFLYFVFNKKREKPTNENIESYWFGQWKHIILKYDVEYFLPNLLILFANYLR